MHTVRLETETGHFVVAGQIPPFQTMPTVVLWGQRVFALYEAGANGHPSRYRERFTVALVVESEQDPIPQREPRTQEERVKDIKEMLDAAPHAKRKDQVDTSCGLAETLRGTPIGPHLEKESSGMQKDYLVLTPEERAKGFVEPVRRSYRHDTCGKVTTMGLALSETYARCPDFYNGTFCATCGGHFPVGEKGEFVWEGTTQKVGTRSASHSESNTGKE